MAAFTRLIQKVYKPLTVLLLSGLDGPVVEDRLILKEDSPG